MSKNTLIYNQIINSISANNNSTDIVINKNLTNSNVIPAGSSGQLQFNDAGALGASPDLSWDNFVSVRGLESTVVVPPLTVGDVNVYEGGEYPDGATVQIRLYPYVLGVLDYYFDPDVFYEVEVQGNVDDNFYVEFNDIVFTGADGWVAINNIDGAGWFGVSAPQESDFWEDYGEEYKTISFDARTLFVKEKQKSAEFEGEVIFKGATSGDGGKLVFKSNAFNNQGNATGSISFESPPAFDGQVNQRFILPKLAGAANSVLAAQTGYSGSGDWVTRLYWTTIAGLGVGSFFVMNISNTASAFGTQVFQSTVPTTTTAHDVFKLQTNCGTGTPLEGHGAALLFNSKANNGSQYDTGRISVRWVNATVGSRATRVNISSISNLSGNGISLSNAYGNANQNVGINGNEITGNILTIYTGASTNKGVVIRGHNGQTAPLLELQNSSAVVIASVNPTGDIEVTNFNNGVILKSPNSTRWRITIDNSGVLTTTSL